MRIKKFAAHFLFSPFFLDVLFVKNGRLRMHVQELTYFSLSAKCLQILKCTVEVFTNE